MASRNVKPSSVQGLDSPNVKDKMQSSTLKRQPSPDWSKSDLLRLLSYFEGELQARDVAIATLKAEKAKQLLYQAKYGRFGLGDPFIALQRDADCKNDGGFDEAAIKSMYDNQLAQLENLIATQRKAQLKMREQLGNSEKRFHKVCSELEEEKQKHAQDTAQGDDVTYMLEKERERLKAEIDFEKSQNKKLEKDLKKTLASLEEERANAARHKQVAIMLIKERKHLIERIVAENQLRDEMETALTDEKSKIQNMAEGLTEESKSSLKKEIAVEKQNSKHDAEREALRLRLHEEEKQTNILKAEVSRLSKKLESLQQHIRGGGSSPGGIRIRSSVSPIRAANSSVPGRSGASPAIVLPSSGSTLQPVSPSLNSISPQMSSPPVAVSTGVRSSLGQHPQMGTGRSYMPSGHKVAEGDGIGPSSPDPEVIYRPDMSSCAGKISSRVPSAVSVKVGLQSTGGIDHAEGDTGARLMNTAPETSATVTAHSGAKVLYHVGGGSSPVAAPLQIRKPQGFGSPSGTSLGRGTPPPIPPNKPSYISPGPANSKHSPPKKGSLVASGVTVQAPRKDLHSGQHSQAPVKTATQQSPCVVQIPVSVVGDSSSPGQGDAIASVHTQVREASPSAFVVDNTSLELGSNTTYAVVTPSADSSATLEFLGPEMASLQQLLATMTTGEVSQSGISLVNVATTSVLQCPVTSSLLLQTTASTSASEPKGVMSSDAGFTPHNGSARNAVSPDTPIINALAKEQNNNAVKDFISNSETQITAKVTAQVSPILVKPLTIARPISEKNSITTPQFLTHHIVSPTAVSPAGLTPTSSSKHNSTSSKSTVNSKTITFPNSSVHPSTTKHRIMPSRARSKSPLKMSHNHPRSYSASARISTNTNVSAAQHHNTNSWLLSSSSVPSLRLSPTTEIHGSPVHHMSALGHVDTLNKILLQKREDANKTLSDGTTPLHCAVESNQEESVKVLLDYGARPSSMRNDRVTPLHMAALRGYAGCLHLLLNKGAAVNVSTTTSQVPLHLSVKAGHTESCQLLLRHGANILSTGQDGLTSLHYAVQNNHPEMLKALLDRLRLTGISRESDAAHQIVAMTDKDGCTITHMAAQLTKQDCLVMLTESLPLDFDAKDKLGRSVKMIASLICKELIPDVDKPPGSMVRIVVELRNIQENTTVFSALLGIMEIGPGIGWRMMEDRLRGTLNSYLNQLDVGLKTRRITRLDADLDPAERDFTLGLAMTNIKHFEIGFYKWTPGMQTDMSPYMMLSNSEQKKITITVDDSDNMCELIAFDVLHPVSTISNYLRLLDQYKSVIFYGPTGSGKSYLAHRLAQSIAAQELSQGRKPAIHQLSLQPGYTFANFLTFLKQRNCIVPVDHTVENFAAVLLLDNLETVDIAKLFGELLDPMEYRGKSHTFCLTGDNSLGNSGIYYLADHLYVIGTMNKSRSLGVDLSILPRFRWIQFRLDTEPLRGLLARHFLRRIFNIYHGCIPSPEDPVFRTIEWIVCVWQRLNDSLNKLGIPEVVQGPCMFFKCPLERQDHKLILEWMQNTWNQQIAPRVREAVKRGTGSEAPSDGQQKVANTALYVLMQRSVILSCPLSGPDKDAYFSGFSGSNELDIPLKSRESRPRGTPLTVLNSPRSSDQQRRPNSIETSPKHSWMDEKESFHSSPSLPGSAFRMGNRSGKGENHTDAGIVTSHIKRRSLSDSSVNKPTQDQQQQYLDGIQSPTSSQAKMAKLEVKSPKIVNIVSAFRSPSLSPSLVPETSPSAVALKKTGRVSPLLTLVANSPHISQKKSRSSENISNSSLYGPSGRLRSPGPFSFSLTTPTSGLNSFKFFDTSAQDGGESLNSQMPDFSVFEKVPTPTDEFPTNHSFVFIGRSDSKGQALHVSNNERKNEEEEIWSKRNDVFKPICRSSEEDQTVLESET
ncbi:hypothetical protein BsWGS_11526 [Bradybaena similaris]